MCSSKTCLKTVTVSLTSLLSSQAFASPWFLPDPIAWYRRTNDVITTNGLHTQVENLAYALVFALFAYGALRASYYARSSEMAALFGRLLLAAALLLSLSPIRSTLHGTWVAAFNWSSGIFSEAESDLISSADNVALLLAPFFTIGSLVTSMGRRVARESTQAINSMVATNATGLASKASSYMNGVLLLFFPLFGMYAALVYTSGFTVLLSMLFLPLAAALTLLPNGASWISRWIGMYLGALFTVMFLPIIFGIAVDLGMVQPLERMSAHMQTALTQFNGAAEALAVPAGSEVWRVAEWQNWLQGIPDSLLSTLGGIGSILLGWLLSLVALIVGMLIGVYLLMNLPGFISGFIGGIGATAATAFGLSRVTAGGQRMQSYRGPKPPGDDGKPPSPPKPNPAPVPSPPAGGARK